MLRRFMAHAIRGSLIVELQRQHLEPDLTFDWLSALVLPRAGMDIAHPVQLTRKEY